MSLGRRIGAVIGNLAVVAVALLVGAMLWGGTVVVLKLIERG